jgi:hypothetical protein
LLTIIRSSCSGALFDRDPTTNKVLWFSGPPLDLDVPQRPSHSGTYLTFLAKRKLEAVGSLGETAIAANGETTTTSEDGGSFWGKEGELKSILFGET